MPRPRFEKLDPDRRERLLVAAATEFAAQGYESASLNRVIESAGISKGAFYYYFDDKADLFGTVVRLAWEVMTPEEPLDLDDLDAESFWPRLHAALRRMVERAGRHPWMTGVARLVYHPPRAARVETLVAEEFERAREWMGRLVRRGQSLGQVRADLPESLILAMVFSAAAAADHWSVDHWDEHEPQAMQAIVDGVFDMLRGLADVRSAERPE